MRYLMLLALVVSLCGAVWAEVKVTVDEKIEVDINFKEVRPGSHLSGYFLKLTGNEARELRDALIEKLGMPKGRSASNDDALWPWPDDSIKKQFKESGAKP